MVNEEIQLEDVEEAIKSIENGKAAGNDEITPEMLIYLGVNRTQFLLQMCRRTWKEGKVPRDWEMAVILPIYKKGDRSDCSNYR